MPKNYEVGRGKPPKHTQFKKGQSGNPKGRPKGRKNMRTIVNNVLNRTVTITENGRTRHVQYMEALSHQMAAQALSGPMRDKIMFFKAFHDYAPELLKEGEPPKSVTVEFVGAKDGKPYPGDEGEASGEKGEDPGKGDKDSGEEIEDPDDFSFLD